MAARRLFKKNLRDNLWITYSEHDWNFLLFSEENKKPIKSIPVFIIEWPAERSNDYVVFNMLGYYEYYSKIYNAFSRDQVKFCARKNRNVEHLAMNYFPAAFKSEE